MTRKTQVVLTAAAVLVAFAVVIGLWLTRDGTAPADDTPSRAHAAPPSANPESPPAPLDPQALAEVREAYRKSLAESAPPGMLELMQGPGQPADGLPPLADPFVTPAQFNPAPAADLPPLPPELASRPELLPPPDESPAAGKAKEGPASDLPPLPPVKNP
jgi:hypothetical protein